MIGLIFGENDFPKKILKRIQNKKKYLIIDLTKKNFFKKDKNSYSVSIGQLGKIIKILNENKCKKILFAGKVEKPSLSKLKLDYRGIYHLPKIIKSYKIGDAAILKEIINIFKKEKIRTVNSLLYTPDLTLKNGTYTKLKPNLLDMQDIKKAVSALSKTNKYNFSQGIVVRNNKVLAIEGKGGTRKMLQKCKKIKQKTTGVLVKFPKKKQDLRIDLPTIGLNTLKQCKTAGIKGIILKNKQHVFLDINKSVNFANKNKLFIKVK
ncbi:UDP-2,3-diacylglucosamine diphosphatase LpxI [Pelagibacteraceae bacterium]|nr:UDP-2,3-diacylglucosamine diphosphatase LpxI [Pelagibacteraceae bacterium]